MATSNHMSGSAGHGEKQTGALTPGSLASCAGDCGAYARQAFDRAAEALRKSGNTCADVDKRFQLLKEITGGDRHKEAEILFEHAVALYEVVYGQEHALVAEMLAALSKLYARHGNADYASYLHEWSQDMLKSEREEPTHEFFHLFAMDEADADGSRSN